MPVKKKLPVQAGRSKPKGDDETTDAGRDDYDDYMQAKAVVKPEDQLQLNDGQLNEEFTRVLTANNPHAPQNIVRYSFKERQFKAIAQVDQLAIHFSLEGNMLHKESDEASRQFARNKDVSAEIATEKASEDGEEKHAAPTEGEAEHVEETSAPTEAPEDAGDEGEPMAPKAPEKKLTNQFNFCERATQTYNNPVRERENETEPPPRATFAANVAQWNIFDDYIEDFEKLQEKNKSKEKAPSTFGHKQETKKKKNTVTETTTDDVGRIEHAVKIVERMVNQNTFDEISLDFRYYEDESDEYRDHLGTLLPLWRFTYDKTRKLATTSLCWSSQYNDLFAVSHGSYDFSKQEGGMICFYTLKNPSFPEYIFETDCGVLCLDIHADYPHMLCVGFYDGSVGVYNTLQHGHDPLYRSSAKTGKHTEPVWQVRWQKDDLDNNMNFFSISADGRITVWTIVKSDLIFHDVITLRLEQEPTEGPDGTSIPMLGCGTTFDFHPKADHLFLVGTEEGRIHKCSKAYSSQFLDTFEAHHMAVYKVIWNSFHPDIFITCSADWTVKIWDHNKKEPMFVFDLSSPVGDVAWAPYSSTVFAAASADGKVHVFDLSINKYEAICVQNVASKKKSKLTHIAFNTKYPIIVVGDDHGTITSLKLSPNLRKIPKEKKGAPPMEPAKVIEMELQKINRILSLVG